jgi:hypothetical protein
MLMRSHVVQLAVVVAQLHPLFGRLIERFTQRDALAVVLVAVLVLQSVEQAFGQRAGLDRLEQVLGGHAVDLFGPRIGVRVWLERVVFVALLERHRLIVGAELGHVAQQLLGRALRRRRGLRRGRDALGVLAELRDGEALWGR